VRIHNSDRAAASADRVGALAYTVGRHIAFAEGRYTPACQSGQKLLAHELAHVVQQSRGIAASDHAPEVQAEAHEQKATQLSTGVATAPRMRLQRKPDAITSIVINLTTSSISITFDDGTTLSGSVKTNLEPRDYTARWDEKSQEFEVAPYPTKERVLQFQVSGTPAFRARYLSARKQVKTPIPLRVSGGPDTKTPPDNSSAPGSLLGGKILASVPVIFIANDVTRPGLGLPAGGTGQGSLGLQGSPFTSIGLGANVLASGDLSWLSNADAARRVLSPDYWEPFLGPARRSVTLDRLVNEIPRDLAPKIEAELAARAAGSPRPLSWVRRGFSEPELISIPDLVRRLDEGGIGRLSPAELEFLRNAASVHVGGSTPGSPFASYSRAGFNVRSIGNRQYRVRVEVARPGVLDLSAPNEFNQFGQLPDITNVEEADLLVVANQQGRLVSVQRLQGVEEASFLLKYGSEIRWGGRIVFVAGLALSAYRVAEAPPDQRAIVASEETGGQIGGFLGTAAAVAGCVALGIATGGVGLFLCGLAGGIIGGVGGSAIGGGIARSFEPYGGPSRPMTQAESEEAARTIDRANLRQPCPSCHELRREWDERLRFRSPSGLSGGNLTPEDLARLRPLFDPAGSSR